jgi:undecaprenyl-diphosphatase
MLKFFTGRLRPYEVFPAIEKLIEGGGYSFPSGHTAEVFTLFFSLYYVFPSKTVRTFFLIWAALIAYTRMIFGVHYPTDILASIVLSYLIVLFSHKIVLPYIEKKIA